MVLSRHHITHFPINLPSATDRVPWIVVHADVLFLSYRISRTYVADEIVEVQVLDVPGILGGELAQAVLAISLLREIIPIELAFQLGTNVFK